MNPYGSIWRPRGRGKFSGPLRVVYNRGGWVAVAVLFSRIGHNGCYHMRRGSLAMPIASRSIGLKWLSFSFFVTSPLLIVYETRD